MRGHVAQRSGALVILALVALSSATNTAARGQTDNQIESERSRFSMRQVTDEGEVPFTEPMPGYSAGTCKFGVACFGGSLHTGTDYSADAGTTVLAIAPGHVVLASDNGKPGCCTIKDGQCTSRGECADHGLGRVVILSHVLADGKTMIYSLYAHLSEISTEAVQANKSSKCIPQGFQIGTVGASGYGIEDYWTRIVKNTRPHLHLEIKQNSILSNPLKSPTYYGYIPKSEADADPINWGYYHPEAYIGRERAKPCPSTQQSIPAPSALQAPPGSTVVDDLSTAFAKNGTSRFWHFASGGNDGSFIWTRNNPSSPDNTGTWTISVSQPGLHEVFVYIPPSHAGTKQAKYEIQHAGKTDVVTVDQSQHHNQWLSLGASDFTGNGIEQVRLTDATGEPDGTKEIAFDAISVIRREQDAFADLRKLIDQLAKDANRMVEDANQTVEKIARVFDAMKDPQKLIDQLTRDLTDKLLQEFLKELRKWLDGVCAGGAAAAMFPALILVLHHRRRSRK